MGRKRKIEVPVVEDSEKKHVLIAILGITPAVLTEAVWALATQRGIVPDEIVVFTTKTGKARLAEGLIASGVWCRLVKALRDEGCDVKGKLKFDEEGSVYLFKDANRKPIEDLRSREDNLEAANMMMKEIHDYASRGTWVIHALLSGGRKTMTALFFSCMCLQGRGCDRIYHVLATDPYEKIPKFFFPENGITYEYVEKVKGREKRKKCKSRDAKIDLFEVPFVYMGEWAEQRCRAISKNLSYENLINDVQKSFNHELYPKHVVLDLTYGQVEFDDKVMELSPVNFMVLAFLLQGYGRQDVIGKMNALKTYMYDEDEDSDGKFREDISLTLPWLYKLGWIGRTKKSTAKGKTFKDKQTEFKQQFVHRDKNSSQLDAALGHDFGLARDEIQKALCHENTQQDSLARLLFKERPLLTSATIDPTAQVTCHVDKVPEGFLEYFFPDDAPFRLRKEC